MKPDKPRPIDIDAAIDRAVRSMMSAEPRAGLRQRVLSRINETPSRAVPLWRLAIAGGGIAVIALAVAVRVLDRPVPPEEPAPVVTTAPRPVTPPPSSRQPDVTPVPPPISAAPPSPRTPPPSQRISRGLVVAQSLTMPEDEDLATTAPMPEALPVLEPIGIAPLQAIQSLEIRAVEIEAIEFKQIGVSRLPEIAPLQGPLR
jgi:hypothetical protein